MLLKDGQPMEDFNTTSELKNKTEPRTAIGYYEPGHYCLVVVDGRQESKGYSEGFTLMELSRVFYELGCSIAYNMDGGKSAEMIFDGKLQNRPYEGGRETSDIIYITEE
jgi:exopolysaccharide biosynthesis protein